MKAFFNHLNPAIIRSVLGKMNKQEFEECVAFIKSQALELPDGTKRQMYVSLYNWCRIYYAKTFHEKEPSLFEGL